jgi:hypothetical protein
VVLETQITQPGIVKSARDITVTILSGDILDVDEGMTIYIGTSQGAKDIGRLRLRSGSGTTLTLAENSVDWEDGWYLTVVRYWEPWGVYPRIDLDDDNVPIFYKDWDIEYTDQNEDMDPVVCMGPNDAGFLNLGDIAPTGSFNVWYTSSGSYNPSNSPPAFTGSAFDWHFEGGTPTGSSLHHPGMVTYTGVGNFVTSLTITTADGPSFTGRRHIRVMARPENEGSEKPAGAWGLGALNGERDSGGWIGDIWMREPANPEDIVDGALVVIFSEDYEGGIEATKIGANAENRGHILFAGYILEDTISYNPETSRVDFSIGGTSARMAELATFATALDDVREGRVTGEDTPPWSRMPYLTVDRALVHFLRWHSTVLAVADFSPTGDTLALKGADLGRGNVWDVSNSFVNSALLGQIVSDRQGKVWTEIRANVIPTGSSRQVADTMQDVIEITRQDWRAEVGIERGGDAGSVAYIEFGGVAWSGAATGTFDAYLSGAPGFAPHYFGSAQRVNNLALLGQDQLNQLAGNAWANLNPRYHGINIPLAGDYRFLDIAPQQRVLMTIAANDTFRRITMDQKPFIPDSMTYEYRPDQQIALVDLDVREETSGGPGETIVIPVEAPYDRPILPDWDIDFPPIVPPDPIEPPIDPPPGSGDIIYLCTANRLTRSRNFVSGRATGSSWEDITPEWATSGPGGGPGGVTGTFRNFYLAPEDTLNTAYLHTDLKSEARPVSLSGPHLYRITNLNGPTGTQSYEEILDPLEWGALYGLGPEDGSSPQVDSFSFSPISPNIIVGLGKNISPFDVNACKTNDGGATWTDITNDFTSFDPGGAEQIKISEKSIQDIWAIAHLQRRMYYTNTQGNSWSNIHEVSTIRHYNWHIPFQGNAADRIHYFSFGTNYRVTDDNFSTDTVINPTWGGEIYRPPDTDIPTDQTRKDMIKTWRGNRLAIASLARGETSGRWAFFYSEDGLLAGVSTWQLRGGLIPIAGGADTPGPLMWHETNPDLLCFPITGNNDSFYLTVDRGISWSGDALDNWQLDIGTIGSPDFLGFEVAGIGWPVLG